MLVFPIKLNDFISLGHPRLHLFITHGGFNSLLEAANAGVPVLLLIGFFQHRNGRVAEHNGNAVNAKRTQRLLATKVGTLQSIFHQLSLCHFLFKAFHPKELLKKNGGQFSELLSESRHMGWPQLHNIVLAAFSALTLLIVLRYFAKFTLK
ncbi:hypothetical protein niasHT_020716 [Heterodera trifolii]|uniref:glucuronosyltransferase n=1 Tax=Heterodera trifolii TaxID=157864 RepID=A0ABD2KMD8_9BILA